MHKTMPDEERFWRNVAKAGPDECWLWTGAKMKSGYGTLGVGSRLDGTNRNVLAHRYVCELTYDLFDGWQALHKCDVKACVNPAHLYVGTHAQNMRDASERKRMRPGRHPGDKNGNAKLKEFQAREIKESPLSLRKLANRFGVSKTQISWIKSGKSWAHLNA